MWRFPPLGPPTSWLPHSAVRPPASGFPSPPRLSRPCCSGSRRPNRSRRASAAASCRLLPRREYAPPCGVSRDAKYFSATQTRSRPCSIAGSMLQCRPECHSMRYSGRGRSLVKEASLRNQRTRHIRCERNLVVTSASLRGNAVHRNAQGAAHKHLLVPCPVGVPTVQLGFPWCVLGLCSRPRQGRTLPSGSRQRSDLCSVPSAMQGIVCPRVHSFRLSAARAPVPALLGRASVARAALGRRSSAAPPCAEFVRAPFGRRAAQALAGLVLARLCPLELGQTRTLT